MKSSSAKSMAFSDHSRMFGGNRYVYPVLSRRSRGISIGINLNPDKVCNFDCIYCQVDRQSPPSGVNSVETGILLDELRTILKSVADGTFYLTPKFSGLAKEDSELKDIAFSGDGEPSVFPGLSSLTKEIIAIKSALGFSRVPLVLITNASGLCRTETVEALNRIDGNGGEIWAKLDAGTPSYFQKVCRTGVDLERILDHILKISRTIPLVIQSCFMRIDGAGPGPDEISAYSNRLNLIQARRGQIKRVQIYTVARKPAELYVEPLDNAMLDEIASSVSKRTGLKVETFYKS